jgi:hypothetical protein
MVECDKIFPCRFHLTHKPARKRKRTIRWVFRPKRGLWEGIRGTRMDFGITKAYFQIWITRIGCHSHILETWIGVLSPIHLSHPI